MTLSETFLKPPEIRELDATTVGQLMSIHPDYRVVTEYARGQGYWRPGDGEPSVILDPPSAQAAGRCAASRVRGVNLPGLSPGAIHPNRCRWCDTPMPDLLRSLDHATFMSRFVMTEYIAWPTKDRKSPYMRASERVGVYENPAWAAFFALAPDDRAYLIGQQQVPR